MYCVSQEFMPPHGSTVSLLKHYNYVRSMLYYTVYTVVITSNAPDPRVCTYAHACTRACKLFILYVHIIINIYIATLDNIIYGLALMHTFCFSPFATDFFCFFAFAAGFFFCLAPTITGSLEPYLRTSES